MDLCLLGAARLAFDEELSTKPGGSAREQAALYGSEPPVFGGRGWGGSSDSARATARKDS